MAFGALIIAVLAGAGGATVARLLAVENGPVYTLNDLRLVAETFVTGLITDKKSELENKTWRSLIEFLTCPVCQSVWWSVIAALVIGSMAGAGWQWIAVAAVASPSIAWAIGNCGGWIKNA